MRRSLLLAALLCITGVVRASGAPSDALRLIAPSDGTTLRGGSLVTLAWSAAELPPHSEEWEAFLSIDGGAHYAFRITPHLDIARRTTTWVVPNVSASDARILIRTGNEHRETHLEIPASFAIERDAHAPLALPRPFATSRPEAARDGEKDVVAWAEGDRAGSDVRVQSKAPRRSESFATHVEAETASDTLLAPKSFHARHAVTFTAGPLIAPRSRVAAAPILRAADLLLVCRRRNI